MFAISENHIIDHKSVHGSVLGQYQYTPVTLMVNRFRLLCCLLNVGKLLNVSFTQAFTYWDVHRFIEITFFLFFIVKPLYWVFKYYIEVKWYIYEFPFNKIKEVLFLPGLIENIWSNGAQVNGYLSILSILLILLLLVLGNSIIVFSLLWKLQNGVWPKPWE